MRAYWAVFFVTLLIQFVPIGSNKGRAWKSILTFLPMFLFGALRTDFGLDYSAYEDIFYGAHYWQNYSDVSEHAETGYIILNRVIPTWRLLLILTSALTCISYGLIFFKCVPSQYSWIAVILLFLGGDKSIFFMYSGMRNAISISIMILAFPLIRDRKWLPYSFLTLLAMQFHTTALLFMPLAYILGRSQPMSKRESACWIGAMLILQVLSLEFFFERAAWAVNNFFDRYSTYADRIEDSADTRSFIIRMVSFVFTLGLTFFMYQEKDRLSSNQNTICRLALFYALSLLLGALSLRLVQCFILFLVCGFSILIYEWRQRIPAFLLVLLCSSYLYYGFFNVFIKKDIFPYDTYHSLIGDF